MYQIAGAYVSIGKDLNAHSHYTEALDTLKLALECVNDHHRLFYDCQMCIRDSLYTLAMENGFSPCDEVRHVEYTLIDENGKPWTPRNANKK